MTLQFTQNVLTSRKRMTTTPDYLTLWPDDEPSVDISSKSRFTWRPRAKELGIEPKATPELLAELAATGCIDGIQKLTVSEWSKTMSGLPVLPESIAASLAEVQIGNSTFIDWSELYALPALQRLVLDEKVSVLPDGIGALKNLVHLEIRGKRLKELPADLDALTSLRELVIVNSPIKALPEKLGELPLERLYLSWTKKLKSLPEGLGSCKTLRQLETISVPLKSLPDELYSSEALEVLSIEGAKLSNLGPRLACPNLRVLNLSGGFKLWPPEVILPKLEEFCVAAGSKITTLPDVYTSNLKHISVHASLESIDPRFAQIENWSRGRSRMGVMLSCTEAALEALSEEERAAFAGRLKAWR
ncbi:MAG: hypothetical protein ACI9KE_000162 [Polyangiales bacterium]|jgi:hypothetical protein